MQFLLALTHRLNAYDAWLIAVYGEVQPELVEEMVNKT
jgi:hypothetical protein